MPENSADLLQEGVTLLRQLVEERRQANATMADATEAIGRHNCPDFEKQQAENERKLKEMRAEGEKRRQEDREYRQQLHADLTELTGLLRELLGKLGASGERQG